MEDTAVTVTTTAAPAPTEEEEDDLAAQDHDGWVQSLWLRADLVSKGADPGERLKGYCELVSEALGEDHTGDRHYPAVEVLGWMARAVEMGCEVPLVGRGQITRIANLELIPNARFRARFEELNTQGKLNYVQLAAKLGLYKTERTRKTRRPDDRAVKHLLGIAGKGDNYKGERRLRMRLFVTYEQAVALADALGIPYYEAGV